MNGESGSGKTETCKYAIDYIADISCKEPALKVKLMQALAILEAFGHAPTATNSNSSRYSKYVELRFKVDGSMESAKINDFLLEKTRVSLDFPHERTFLIFYYMMAGLDKNMMDFLKLGSVQSHRYLNVSSHLDIHKKNIE